MQGAPIGAAEGGGDALGVRFECRGAIGGELELSGEHFVDAPAQHRPIALPDREVSSRITRIISDRLRLDLSHCSGIVGEQGEPGSNGAAPGIAMLTLASADPGRDRPPAHRSDGQGAEANRDAGARAQARGPFVGRGGASVRRTGAAALLAFAMLLAECVLPGGESVAQAEVLVANTGQSDDAGKCIHNTHSRGQAFRTGADVYGYDLENIVMHVEDAPNDWDDVTVRLAKGPPRAPGGTLNSGLITTLVNPASGAPNLGRGQRTWTLPSGTSVVLLPQTQYTVEIGHDSGSDCDFKIDSTNSDSEDSNSNTGWSIDNSHRHTAAAGNAGSFLFNVSDAAALRIKVNGSAATDTTAPTLKSASVVERVTLNFDEELDEDSKPDTSAFTVRVDGVEREVSAVSIVAKDVTLTLQSAVEFGQTVTVSYTPPTANPLRDAAVNEVAAFMNEPVRNELREGGVCDRTEQIKAELVRVSGVSTCTFVTNRMLAAISSLDLSNKSIETLMTGDFEGLTSLSFLNLSSNEIETLTANDLDGLTALEYLDLKNNELSIEGLPNNGFNWLPGGFNELWLSGNPGCPSHGNSCFPPTPVINVGEGTPEELVVRSGETVTMTVDIGDYVHPLGRSLKRTWTQKSGEPTGVSGRGITMTFTVPEVVEEKKAQFSVTIEAGGGGRWAAQTLNRLFASMTVESQEMTFLPQPEWSFAVTGDETDENGNIKVVEGDATATATATITNGVTFDSEQTISLWWDGTPLRGAAGTATPGELLTGPSDAITITIPANASSASLTLTAYDDDRYWPEFNAPLVARHGPLATDSTVGSAVTLAYENDDAIPSISNVAFTSDPGTDNTYGIGDEVAVTFTFSAPVDVKPGAGTIEIVLDSEQGAVEAQCEAKNNTITMRCVATIEEGDKEEDGLAVTADTLTLVTGAKIQAEGTAVDAVVTHGEIARDASHRIDAIRPTVEGAWFAGTTVSVIFDKTLNEDSVPTAPGGFTINASSGTNPTVTAVAVADRTVTLTTSPAADPSKTYTLGYTAPGTNPIEDAIGNEAEAFTGQAVLTIELEWTFTVTSDTTDTDGNPVIVENGDAVTVTATITNTGYRPPAVVDVALQWDGTDIGGTDAPGRFLTGAGTESKLTIPAGMTSATVTISAVNDALYNPTQTAELTGTYLGTEMGREDVTLRDDEGPPTLTISLLEETITEGEAGRIGATLNRGYAQGRDVDIATVTGATEKLDSAHYDATGAKVTLPFAAGDTELNTTLPTLDNTTPGDGGQVVFTVPTDDPLFTAGNPPSSVTLTIVDDDAAPTAPRNLTSSAGDGSVRLTWQRPMSYETTQLTGYELKVTPGVGSFTSFADIPDSDAGTTSYEVTGLTNDIAYTFELQAKNDHGSSSAVSVMDTPRKAGVFAADTATVTEGGSTTITIVPEGAPFGTTKTVTVVVASPDVRDRARAGSDFDVSAGGQTMAAADRPFNRLRFTGGQPHYEIDLSPTDIDMTLTVAAVDDSVAECREEIFIFAYTDYGTSNERRITQYANKYVARNVFIEDDDNRAELVNAIVDSRTVTLTFDQVMRLVEEPDDPDDPGYKPNPPHNYFTLFEAKSPGVPPPDDSNSGQENLYKTAYGTLARTFALSGRDVTLTFPHAVDTTHGAWVRYNQSGRYAPLGKPRFGRCGHAVSGASWALTNSATGGTVTTPLPQLSVSADREGTEGTHADIPFTVRLDPASTETVVVDYRTVERTAKAGEDFTATSGTLTFAPGDIAKTVRVPIVDDTVPDDGETFLLDIFDASGATFAGGAAASFATGTIRNTEAGEQPETPANTLTASFTNVPAEHGGGGESNRFTFDLAFSENLELSYKTLRDHAFTVTGGDVKKAQRKVQGSNRTWTITVEPDGWGDVSLTLPGGRACTASGAICAAGDRQLSNSPSATVQGPAALSVADASATEGSDATLDFAVSLDRASTLTVTVDYATADGTATAGADYTATSGTLTFAPGDVATTVSVPILDDVHDDGGETLTLTLSNASNARIADGTATGTIANSDPIPKAWLARFGRTVGDHVVDAIGERLKGSPGGGSQVTLGGQKIPLDGAAKGASGDDAAAAGKARDALAAFADRVSGGGAEDGTAWARRGVPGGEDTAKGREARGLSEREMLLGSSFLLAAGGDGANASGTAWTAWGRAAASRFDGNADGLSLDGDVTTFTLGADAARGRWLGGVALAHSTGAGGFRDHAEGDHASRGSGELESTLTSVHPYLRFEVSERLSTWGILGYGTGDLTLTVDAAGDDPRKTWKTDTSMWMAAAGARGVIVSAEDTGGFELAARGDARLVRMSSDAAMGADGAGPLRAAEAETSRLRFILEGSHRIELVGGQTLRPSLEIGLRNDGGDAETGTGIEVGGGIAWADPALGLTVEGKARGLVAHEDADYTEWGASGSVRIDPGASGRGLSLTLSPAWGADSGNAERLWGLRDARGLAANEDVEPAGRLDAEAGWGFGAFGGRGLVTPFAGLALSEAGERTWRSGVRWTLGPDLAFGVEGTLREAANDNPGEHGIGFRLTARW